MKRRLEFGHLPQNGDDERHHRQAEAERRQRNICIVEFGMLNDQLPLYHLFRENFLARFSQDVPLCPSDEHEEEDPAKHETDDIRRKAKPRSRSQNL